MVQLTGGTVDAVEHGEYLVRQLEPQDDQGGDHSIGEHQLVVGSAACGPQAFATSAFTQLGVLLRHPGTSQPGDRFTELAPADTGADTMREGRAGEVCHRTLNLHGLLHVTDPRPPSLSGTTP
ncbi:hypothetical protein [Streptomyces sp. NBC_01589]|uniref:hypothetical protein n=1 Tax=unclassified Streptomyces TaxID=2593676 RepID=UPI00386F1A47